MHRTYYDARAHTQIHIYITFIDVEYNIYIYMIYLAKFEIKLPIHREIIVHLIWRLRSLRVFLRYIRYCAIIIRVFCDKNMSQV